MIKVKFIMYPFGDTENPDEFGEIEIVNEANHEARPKFGNYRVTASFDGHPVEKFKIINHHREDGIIPLMHAICERLK